MAKHYPMISWLNIGPHLQDVVEAKQEALNRLFIFSYANNRFTQFYLNISKQEAENRFCTLMQGRTCIEKEEEGWLATAIEVVLTDNAWVGNAHEEIDGMVRNLFQGMVEGAGSSLNA